MVTYDIINSVAYNLEESLKIPKIIWCHFEKLCKLICIDCQCTKSLLYDIIYFVKLYQIRPNDIVSCLRSFYWRVQAYCTRDCLRRWLDVNSSISSTIHVCYFLLLTFMWGNIQIN